MSSNYFI